MLLLYFTIPYQTKKDKVMKLFKKVIVLFLLLMSTMQAQSYQHVSTTQLEKEVEQRSIAGTLPFAMGLELIKRWSHS